MQKLKFIRIFSLYIAYAVILLHSFIPHQHHEANDSLCLLGAELHERHLGHECGSEFSDWDNCSCELQEHSDSQVCHFNADIFNISLDISDLFIPQVQSFSFNTDQISQLRFLKNKNNCESYYLLGSSKRGPPVC